MWSSHCRALIKVTSSFTSKWDYIRFPLIRFQFQKSSKKARFLIWTIVRYLILSVENSLVSIFSCSNLPNDYRYVYVLRRLSESDLTDQPWNESVWMRWSRCCLYSSMKLPWDSIADHRHASPFHNGKKKPPSVKAGFFMTHLCNESFCAVYVLVVKPVTTMHFCLPTNFIILLVLNECAGTFKPNQISPD